MRTSLPVVRVAGGAGLAFSLSLVGLGVLGLAVGDFTYFWQAAPAWVPARAALAVASGALLVAGGLGLGFDRAAQRSAWLLTFYCVAACLLLRLPAIVATPLQAVAWGALGEVASIAAAAWLVALALGAPRWVGPRAAQVVFALAILSFGVEHFVYARYTATLVPAWLPAHLAWVYVTGAAHIAAGLALLIGFRPRLAATLWALMLTLFTLLVWLPAVASAHATRNSWTEFLLSWAIAAAGWIVARSYGSAP